MMNIVLYYELIICYFYYIHIDIENSRYISCSNIYIILYNFMLCVISNN